MACVYKRLVDSNATTYRVVMTWQKSREHGRAVQEWLRGDEATGFFDGRRVPYGEGEGVDMTFTDPTTATAFKLKFG